MKKIIKSLFALFLLTPALVISSCGKNSSNSSEVITTHEHDYGTLVGKVDATCTQDGHQAYYYCSGCEKYFDSSKNETTLSALTIKATGHTVATKEAKDPTCTETGLTEGSYCSVCGEIITKQEVVDAKGHKATKDEAVAATCTTTGLTEGSHCSVCGEVIVAQQVTKALGHTETTDAKVDPTCTETGLTEGSHCSVCGKILVEQETIKATGHDFGAITITKTPTLTEDGEGQRVCTNNSNHVESVVVPKLSNSIWSKTNVKASTCLEKGKDEYNSTAFGKVEVELPLADHNYEWKIDEKATVLAAGKKHEECTVCHDKKNENTVIPILECSHSNNQYTAKVDATCTTNGKKAYYYCEDCHKYYEETESQLDEQKEITDIDSYGIISAIDHNYGAWQVVTEPTETTTGQIKRVCANDASHIETVDLPVLTDLTFWTRTILSEKSCTSDRNYKYEKVEYSLVFNAHEDKLGHDWGDWEVTTTPTTTQTGLAKRACSHDANHEHDDTLILPALSDTESYSYVTTQAATCVATGTRTYTLKSNTDITFSAEAPIDESNHSYGEWTVVTAPTETTEGKFQRVCSLNESHVQVLDTPNLKDKTFWAAGTAIKATCTSLGMVPYTNAANSLTFNYEFGELKGHKEAFDYYTENNKWYRKRYCENEDCDLEEITEITVLSVSEFLSAADTENAKYVKGYVVSAQAKASAASMEFHISDGTNMFYVASSLAADLGDEVLINTKYVNANGKITSSSDASLCKVLSSGNDYVAKSGTVNQLSAQDIADVVAEYVADNTKTIDDFYASYWNKYFEITGYVVQDPSITSYAAYVLSTASDGNFVAGLSANGDYDLSIYATKQVVIRAFVNYITINRGDTTTVKPFFRIQSIDLVGSPTYSVTIDNSITNGTIVTTIDNTALTGIKYGTKIGFTSTGAVVGEDTYVLQSLSINGVNDSDAAGNVYSFIVTVLDNVTITATYKVFDKYDTVKTTALISSIAAANEWTDSSVNHRTIEVNDIITLSCSSGGNDGKVYNSDDWRVYNGGFIKVTLKDTETEKYTLKGVTFTWTDGAITGVTKGVRVDLSNSISNNATFNVTATTKITKIIVEYKLLKEEEIKLASAVATYENPFADGTYSAAKDITLDSSFTHDEVNYTLAWSIVEGGSYASITGSTLSIANPTEEGTVKVNVVFTNPNSISCSKQFEFDVAPENNGTKFTCDFTLQTAGVNVYNSSWAYGDFTVANGANYNKEWAYVKLGGKSSAISGGATPSYIETTNAIAKAIDSVTVNYAAGSLSKTGMSVTSVKLYVYTGTWESTTASNIVDTVVSTYTITKSAGSETFVPTKGTTWAANCKFRIEYVLANTTTTNGIVCVESVVIHSPN